MYNKKELPFVKHYTKYHELVEDFNSIPEKSTITCEFVKGKISTYVKKDGKIQPWTELCVDDEIFKEDKKVDKQHLISFNFNTDCSEYNPQNIVDKMVKKFGK